MEKIRVLVAEDNLEMCDILNNFFLLTEDIELCGMAHDGEDALEKIRTLTPDVVLLDIIMPKMDGISVLENLRDDPPARRPDVIVATAIGQERITSKALELGANYYMIKPYSLKDLQRRIMMVMAPVPAPMRAQEESGPSVSIAQEVMKLGVPTNILGFKYIVEAIKIILSEKCTFPISKQVYALIADGNSTTVECVESALRKAIQRIYEIDSESFQGFLKDGKRPSNARFLTMLAEKIKLEGGDSHGESRDGKIRP